MGLLSVNKAFVKYLLMLYAGGMIMLSLLRLTFFVYFFRSATESGMTDILLAFGIGLIMDSNAVAGSLLFCHLLCMPLRFFTENYKLAFFYLFTIAINMVLAINLVDIFYFKQYGSRMNMLAMEVFNHPSLVLPMMYRSYPLIRILLFCVCLFWVSLRIHKKLSARYLETKHTPGSLKWSLAAILGLFVLSFVYYGPPLWSITAFSSSSTLNQMSSNGVYSLIKSYDQDRIYDSALDEFGDISDTQGIECLKKAAVHADEKLTDPNFPLLRISGAKAAAVKKDIVIVIVESFSASYVGCVGGEKLTPEFDRWSRKGVLFDRCYGNGPRTQNGLTSVLAGFPSVLGTNLIRRKGLNEFHTIGNILRSAGYKTQLIHNGDITYDDMNIFITQGGFDEVTDVKQFDSWLYKNQWGVCDEDLYNRSIGMLWKDDRPTLSVLLTMSNHAPFDLPDYYRERQKKINENPVLALFTYTDYALGKFLDSCSRSPRFKNTIFLVVADHGEIYIPDHIRHKMFHIPALLLNTSQPNGTDHRICSQADLAPTVLNEAGLGVPFHFAGQNIFSRDFKPFAISRGHEPKVFMRTEDGVAVLDLPSDKCALYPLNAMGYMEPSPLKKRSDAEKRFIKEYLHGLSVIYRKGLHQVR